MKVALSFIVVLSVLVFLASAMPAGPAQRKNNGNRIAVAAQAPRAGRKIVRPAANLRGPANLRRGRQEEGAVAPPPPAAAAADAAGEAESEVPAWCDPSKEMGAWLNFVKMRKWCADNGYTNFGPYGGVPVEADTPAEASDAPAPPPAE